MFKLLFCLIPSLVFADTAIYLNQEQLNLAKKQVQQSGDRAIKNINSTSKELAAVRFNQLDLTAVESEIEYAKGALVKAPRLTNKLPSGQKYYLFSESVVSDTKTALTQYKKPLDINQSIADYNALIKNAKAKLSDNRLLIFVSSSMPKRTIVNLMQQSSALGAVFIVRGLINGSYVNTYRYFYNLKGKNTVGIMINPTLFKAMQVDIVPTFALYQAEQDLMHSACNLTPKYSKVSGEVTVHFALEQLTRSDNAELAQIATNELDILDNIKYKN